MYHRYYSTMPAGNSITCMSVKIVHIDSEFPATAKPSSEDVCIGREIDPVQPHGGEKMKAASGAYVCGSGGGDR